MKKFLSLVLAMLMLLGSVAVAEIDPTIPDGT